MNFYLKIKFPQRKDGSGNAWIVVSTSCVLLWCWSYCKHFMGKWRTIVSQTENMLRVNKLKRGEYHEEKPEENPFVFSCLFSSTREVQKWELVFGKVLKRVLESGGSLGALGSCCVNHQSEEKEVIPENLLVFCGGFLVFNYLALVFQPQVSDSETPPTLLQQYPHRRISGKYILHYRQQKGTEILKPSFSRLSSQCTVQVPSCWRCSVFSSSIWGSPNVLPFIPWAKKFSCITKSATPFSHSQSEI